MLSRAKGIEQKDSENRITIHVCKLKFSMNLKGNRRRDKVTRIESSTERGGLSWQLLHVIAYH